METIENTKLIDKFMGHAETFDIIDSTGSDFEDQILEQGVIKNYVEQSISHFAERYCIEPIAEPTKLKYKVWAILMPVVKKISNTKDLDACVKWESITATLIDDKLAFYNDDIETVYEAALEFINWYNKQKQ